MAVRSVCGERVVVANRMRQALRAGLVGEQETVRVTHLPAASGLQGYYRAS